MLQRLGYRVRRVQKATPVKRGRERAAIVANVRQAHQTADAREDSWRIAIDIKAKVHVGACARGGQSRGEEATKALDHAMRPKEKLVPCGILAVLGGLLTILGGTARETSACIADGLQQWWDMHKERDAHMRQLYFFGVDLGRGAVRL